MPKASRRQTPKRRPRRHYFDRSGPSRFRSSWRPKKEPKEPRNDEPYLPKEIQILIMKFIAEELDHPPFIIAYRTSDPWSRVVRCMLVNRLWHDEMINQIRLHTSIRTVMAIARSDFVLKEIMNHHLERLNSLAENRLSPEEVEAGRELVSRAELAMYAATYDRAVCLKRLLKLGVDPNVPSRNGVSLLHLVVENSSVRCAEMLLYHGANVNQRAAPRQTLQTDGENFQRPITPLIRAVQLHNVRLADLFIRYGADATPRFDYCEIKNHHYLDLDLLGFATITRDLDMMELLLYSGVGFSIRTYNPDRDCIEYAIATNDIEMIKLLIKYEYDNDTYRFEGSDKDYIQSAIKSGHIRVVRTLLEYGIYLERTGILGWAIDHDASLDILSILLDYGAVASAENLAALGDRPQLASYFFDRDRRCIDKALEGALLHGSRGFVQLCLRRGANPNQRAEYWKGHHTLLWMAFERNNMSICRMLLEAGANDLHPTSDREGRVELILAAVDRRSTDYLKLLLKHGAVISECPEALIKAAILGNASMGKLLLENGIDTANRATDGFHQGRTAHDIATEYGHREFVRMLEAYL